MKLLEVSGISKEEGGQTILDNVSFVQNTSQNIAIAGESGAGKTTLLKIIAGLAQADQGRVLFKNKRIEGPFEKLIPGHAQIAYHSQHYELRNHYRVEEILEYANKLPGEQATDLYEVCRIGHLLKRRTSELSGGEKQRVALARVLSTFPGLLLLDEPFSNLDLIHTRILKAVISDLGKRLNITCLLASHDSHDMLSWAAEIIVMKNGKVVQRSSPEQIYNYPKDSYVAGLFGKYNVVNEAMIRSFPRLAEKPARTFLRPENFKMVNHCNGSIIGTVDAVNYMGSHYETEVTLPGLVLTINAGSLAVKKGEKVFVTLNI